MRPVPGQAPPPYHPRHSPKGHLQPLPGPSQAWRSPTPGGGNWGLETREVRGSSWGQGRYSLGSLPQFPPASRYTPCQLGRSVGGTESCSTGLSSRTPAAGVVWKPHYRNKWSLSWVCVYSWGGAAAGLPGGTLPGGSYPTDQMGVKAWGPEPGGPRPPGQAVQSPRHAAGTGALGGSRDKLRQEQSESPPCELPQEMSTDRPPRRGPRRRCQRRAGRSTWASWG